MTEGRIKNGGSLWPWIAAGALLAVGLGAGAYFFFSEAKPVEKLVPAGGFAEITGYAGPTISAKLYFPSKDDGYLKAEVRPVREVVDKTEQVKEVVGELIRGPRPGGVLTPSFPAAARVKSVLIDDKGTAYVNFSRELIQEHPGGAWTETLTIYSLVNTLAEDFPEIKRVKILVEGAEVPTLAGHIDTSRPFVPRAAMNRG